MPGDARGVEPNGHGPRLHHAHDGPIGEPLVEHTPPRSIEPRADGRTGHAAGSRAKGTPIQKPSPSWSVFERCRKTSAPSPVNISSETSIATRSERRTAKPRGAAPAETEQIGADRTDDGAQLVDTQRRRLAWRGSACAPQAGAYRGDGRRGARRLKRVLEEDAELVGFGR